MNRLDARIISACLLLGSMSLAGAVEYRATEVSSQGGRAVENPTDYGDVVGYTSRNGGQIPTRWNRGRGFDEDPLISGLASIYVDRISQESYVVGIMNGTGGFPTYHAYNRQTGELTSIPSGPGQGSILQVIDHQSESQMLVSWRTQFSDIWLNYTKSNGVWSYTQLGNSGRGYSLGADGAVYGNSSAEGAVRATRWLNGTRTLFSVPVGTANSNVGGQLRDGSYVGLVIDQAQRAYVARWTDINQLPTLTFVANNAFAGANYEFASQSGTYVFEVGAKHYLWSPDSGARQIRDLVPGVISSTGFYTFAGMDKYGRFTLYRGLGETYFYYEPVPEPATLTALGLGALALLRRRQTKP